jgi:hemolysin activation/secretion protein
MYFTPFYPRPGQSLLPTLALVMAGLAQAPAQAQAQAAAPAVSATSGTSAEPVATVGGLRFDILEFVVEGNSVLPANLVEQALSPYLGEGKSIADAEGARKALEKVYQDAGFLSVAVELPPQRVDSQHGEVKLLVTEAKLEKLRVTDARYSLPSQIRQGLPSLVPGTVPNFQDMQDELADLGRQGADRDITPLVTAGDQDGNVNIDMKVQDSLPLHGSLEVNSKQSPNTQRTRLEASVSYDNLWQRQHAISAYWFYSPLKPSESNVLSLSYQMPLGPVGDRLIASLTTSNSNTPTALGGATVSKGETYGLRWRHNLATRGTYSHGLTWGLEYHNAKDANQDVAGFSTENVPLRYPTLGVSYDLTDIGAKSGRVTTLEAALTMSSMGLSGQAGGACTDAAGQAQDAFACKRSGASPTFQVFKLNASHREPIYQGWGISARLQSQLASGPMVPAEQMVLGGVDSVRGYLEGEQAGDNGMSLRAELFTPTWVVQGFGLTALAFVDRGQLLRLEALAGETKRTQLGSSGLALRVEGPDGLKFSFDWARVLFDTPLSGGLVGRGHRAEVSLRQAF